MSDNKINPSIHFASVAPALFQPTELQMVLREHSLAVAKGMWSDYRIDCEKEFTCVTVIAGNGNPRRTFTIWEGQDSTDKQYEVQDFGNNPIQTNDFGTALSLFKAENSLNSGKTTPKPRLHLVKK